MTYALAAAQTALVAVLLVLSWSRERAWARAGVVAAGTWTLIFLIPSWVFAADPSLLTVGSRNRAIVTVDLSLVCLIIGYGVRQYAPRVDLAAPPRFRELARGHMATSSTTAG